MENKDQNDFNSLSDMLSRNKERKTPVENSADDIIGSIKNSAFTADDDDDSQPYRPDMDFAQIMPESQEAPENTIMMSAVEAPHQVKSPKKRKSSPEARKREMARREAARKLARQKSRNRTILHIFGGIFLSICIVVVSFYLGNIIITAALDFTGIVSNEFEIQVEIPEDPTTEEIAQILEENGIITTPKCFEFFSKLKKADDGYFGGVFTLSSAMSYSHIIATLQTETVINETITLRIVEGMTAREIGLLLEENHVCKADDFTQFYLNKMDKYSFEKRVLQNSLKFYQLEGYLFPDTYEFYVNNDLKENPSADIDTSKEAGVVAEKIYANFNSKITKELYKTMNSKGFTLDELVTLASMVQAEAATLEDMQLVASVFINRLNSPDYFPKLQSDVTVFYVEQEIKPYYSATGISTPFQRISDAYDTYVADGIPVGPVCNPGMDAIEAVLYAPETDYYYFCANENTLETYYARTIDEHEANLVLAGLA